MEKVLNLKMPGVQELGREELKEVEGGSLWILLGLAATALATHVAWEFATNSNAHYKAFNEGREMYVSSYTK